MKVYTYSEARQKLSALLNRARREGEVRIKRRDGQEFIIKPVERGGSPLDVPGIDLDLSADEIVDTIRQMREREA